MRLGRLLLAGLTALAAYSYAQAAPQPDAHQSLRLLQAVVPILVHAADSVSSTPALPAAAHTVFSFDALAATPLCGSVCLIASVFVIGWRRPPSLLRC